MEDFFVPLDVEELASWIGREFASRGSILGIPGSAHSQPTKGLGRLSWFGKDLESPIGVAAGPHSQMAQNIAAAYVSGARVLELKTIQVLDRLQISKPCIDMRDVGYNCEWSQELPLTVSREQYADGWILVHALAKLMGHRPGGVSFVMSVGYDLAGIKSAPVQDFIKFMRDYSRGLEERAHRVRRAFGNAGVEIEDFEIPSRISDTVTVSTMHGCPPEEIERIGTFLLDELGLNTIVKVNPTLIGPERLRDILHGALKFDTIRVPDEAFEHDPDFGEMTDIVEALRSTARRVGVHFGLKLTNTLETNNIHTTLPGDVDQCYMSGRALHPISVALAKELASYFKYEIPISFSGGADAWNTPDLLACGLGPVTTCSDLLRPGGYGRLSQYAENIESALLKASVNSLDIFPLARALENENSAASLDKRYRAALPNTRDRGVIPAIAKRFRNKGTPVDEETIAQLFDDDSNLATLVRLAGIVNLEKYAEAVTRESRYANSETAAWTKSSRPLDIADCSEAPCERACPAGQRVPEYVRCAALGKFDEALEIILEDNPLPGITGSVCDHPCQTKCVRQLYDAPIAIRGIKKYMARSASREPKIVSANGTNETVGIVGGGPSGLAAAFFCRARGYRVTVYEASEDAGGLARTVIPHFRLDEKDLIQDIERVRNSGVIFRFNSALGRDFSLDDMQRAHDYVYVALGAGRGRRLGIPGENTPGVEDGIEFLRRHNRGQESDLGEHVLVVGGGNSAVDVARSAARQVARGKGTVTIIYRRTLQEMPASKEEVNAAIEEGIAIKQLLGPARVTADKAGNVTGLECTPMELGEPDETGRRRPIPGGGDVSFEHASTIFVAIGQGQEKHALERAGLELEKDGRIKVDKWGASTLSGVFAGGDAVRGPATVARAIQDARSFAKGIHAGAASSLDTDTPDSLDRLLYLKSRRYHPASFHPGADFGLDQWVRESERCMQCHRLCALCVTVCPNRANILCDVEAGTWEVPIYTHERGGWIASGTERLEIKEAYQVANIADLCNECGNCTVFCPTSGTPFRDKIRIYRNKTSPKSNSEGTSFLPQENGWTMVRGGAFPIRVTYDRPHYEIRTGSVSFQLDENYSVCKITPLVSPDDIFSFSLLEGVKLARIGAGIGCSFFF